jgi:hypothetical protein
LTDVDETAVRTHAGTRSIRLLDAAFLAVVTTVPAFFYTHGLGFYFDDHFFLGLMSTSHDQSLRGLYDALTQDPKSQLRPVEYFGLALMYRLFGTDPLPYHLVLAALVPACALAMFLALSRLGLPRFISVTTPLLFATAPHYSSDKFWPDAYSPTLTLTLFLISVYASLRAVATSGGRFWLWLLAAGIAMVGSVFMYEITLPAYPVLVLYHLIQARREGGAWRTSAGALGVLLGVIVAVKLVYAIRVGGETSYGIGYDDGFVHHIAYVASGAIKVNFGTYGIGLPYVLGWIAAHRLTWSALGAAAVVGIASFLYLTTRMGRVELPREMPRLHRRPIWQYLGAAGIGLLIVGYGIFFVTSKIYLTSAGIDNRVNIIAALGMVFIALAVIVCVIEYMQQRRRATAFALLIAVLAAVGTFITTTIGSYWQDAAARQRGVLAGIRSALPPQPRRLTVVLDGTCPEIGPAVVFSAEDLSGALHTIYRNGNVTGVVATPTVAAHRRGLLVTTYIYNYVVEQFFSYGKHLKIYDYRRDRLETLGSQQDARAYLAATPRLRCAKQRTFVWGLRPSRLLPFS